MGLLSSFWIGKPKVVQRVVRAKYDAAQTSADNERHWKLADALAADAAMDTTVRRTLRNRCRYECANNSYAHGMVRSIAEDTIGVGPRLQLRTDASNVDLSPVERAWRVWADSVDLNGILRVMRSTRARDGEVFLFMGNDPSRKAATGV